MDNICFVKNLSFSYCTSKKILNNITFEVNRNEIVGILGRNGSGKTTLLNLITGFIKNYSGEIYVKGQDIKTYTSKNRARTISYIQQALLQVPNYYYVDDFVLEGRRPFRQFGFYTKDDYTLLENVLTQCKLDNFRNCLVHELSGGELQRCIFAKAIMKQSDFFVFDEPLSAMDIKFQKDFFNLSVIAKEELNAGILLTIHDINLAVKFCDKLLVIDSGNIIYNGNAKLISQEILSQAFDTEISSRRNDSVYFYY